MSAERRSTAIHEAGHAVVGRMVGLFCGQATIAAEGEDDLGHAVIDDPRFSWKRGDGPKRKLVDAFCVALYAGAEAERTILDSPNVGDVVDRDRSTACLSWIGVPGAGFVGDHVWERYEERLRRKAAELVRTHHRKIECVADALMSCRTLSKREIDTLMDLSPRGER